MRRVGWSTGGDVVARRLEEHGIEHTFSLPGSQVLPVWDAIDRRGAIRIVVPRNERSGAFMAEGYGLASGRPAVLMSTLGPGVANELVGLASALASGAPVLCVSPAQPTTKAPRLREVFQGLDHARFFEGNVKRTIYVEGGGSEIAAAIDRACRECTTEPAGPVRVDVSFPHLFTRSLSRISPAPRRTRPGPRRRSVIVREVPTDDRRVLEQLGLPSGNGAHILAPGIGEPGFGLPFAIGAYLGCPEAPVVLLTTETHLGRQLDSLATARALGLPLRVLAADVHGRATEMARAFGFPTEPLLGGRAEIGDALTADPRPLSIVVG